MRYERAMNALRRYKCMIQMFANMLGTYKNTTKIFIMLQTYTQIYDYYYIIIKTQA